jgi:hypothetical protein
MPKLLRPRQEFPTPLFRMCSCIGAAVGGALPGLLLLGWSDGYTVGLLTGAVVIGSIAAARGGTGSRLRTALILAALAMLVVDAVVYAIAFITYPWE